MLKAKRQRLEAERRHDADEVSRQYLCLGPFASAELVGNFPCGYRAHINYDIDSFDRFASRSRKSRICMDEPKKGMAIEQYPRHPRPPRALTLLLARGRRKTHRECPEGASSRRIDAWEPACPPA